MKYIWYSLIFVFGLFLGGVAIDIGHIGWGDWCGNRFLFHNIYVMYLICGACVGLIARKIVEWCKCK